jgi:hypothetical protein
MMILIINLEEEYDGSIMEDPKEFELNNLRSSNDIKVISHKNM